MDPESESAINRILDFWFTCPIENWFQPAEPDVFDAQIRSGFESLVTQARSNDKNHNLSSWEGSARGTLALLILLDQFPRNVYRGSAAAHASDTQACEVAVRAVARGFDRSLEQERGSLHAVFFYLPLMHDESLVAQVACVALLEGLLMRCPASNEKDSAFLENSVKFARGHRDTIREFGRFPSRNRILGRESTPQETRFLEEHPGGFF